MLSLRSPAKINLFLRILHKRGDGYHELASLFQAVDLCDQLFFEEAAEDRLTCSEPFLSCGEDNTILRALSLFKARTGIQKHFHIHLEKRIPLEAGLGGGSSNCATTLYALNLLCQTNLSEEELRLWSSQISADAPFFFSTGTAYCEGIGERVCSLPSLSYLSEKKIYLCKPREGISTKKIFSHFEFSKCDFRSPEELLHGHLIGRPLFVNDLEPVVYQLSPFLKKMRKECEVGPWEAFFMTGSGSAHVGISSQAKSLPKDMACYSVLPLSRVASCWY